MYFGPQNIVGGVAYGVVSATVFAQGGCVFEANRALHDSAVASFAADAELPAESICADVYSEADTDGAAEAAGALPGAVTGMHAVSVPEPECEAISCSTVAPAPTLATGAPA